MLVNIQICVRPIRNIFGKWESSPFAKYRGADKSLARPWKETSYSDQDYTHYTKTRDVQTTGIYSCCLYVTSLGIVGIVLVAVACFLPGSD